MSAQENRRFWWIISEE